MSFIGEQDVRLILWLVAAAFGFGLLCGAIGYMLAIWIRGL